MLNSQTLREWIRPLPVLSILMGSGLVALAVGADLIGVGGDTGLGPNQISLTIGGFAVLVSGLVQASPVSQRRFGEWILVGISVIAVALAADLLIIRGLPNFGYKHVMLVLVTFGLILIGADRAAQISQRSLPTWNQILPVDSTQVARFAGVLAQLTLLVLVIREFQLENQAFYHNILLLTIYGFIIHSLLPLRYRLPFFALLSFAAILGIFGFQNGAWLIGTGLVLIGITHLPLAFGSRIAILLGTGLLIAILRLDQIQSPWPRVIWPILGSMFMFRLIVYVYDLKHQKGASNVFRTLSYFFLFPVIVTLDTRTPSIGTFFMPKIFQV